ncbi:hypothetical protein B0H15DRAFT_927139 [Mycena belliarum]|uniref:F-box domain-containing protein n=1 Tax=Mycena belliarum TaxID=1033014 RepID=A0AAD6Y0L5_9AGAR|nr:hypothetical protein B0H15DRAFT_927139 [Mycena belliae]
MSQQQQLGVSSGQRMVDLTGGRLPDEILIGIFCFALPPSWVMTWAEATAPFPLVWSADSRMKLAIIKVCRTWHRVGLEFLYQSVVIRQIGQLAAFVHALEARGSLGSFVRHFAVSCFQHPRYRAMRDTELSKVFALCANLTHFAYTPQLLTPPPPLLPAVAIPVFPSTITRLEFGLSIDYRDILPALAYVSPTLLSLSLMLPGAYPTDHPPLVFTQLESLRLDIAHDSMIPASHWAMPALRRVLVHDHFRFGLPAYAKRREQLDAFLAAYGFTLTSLAVSYLKGGSLQALLDRCPMLEYIAVSRDVFAALPTNHHPTLAAIDVFVDNHIPDIYTIPFFIQKSVHRNQASLPALRICRYLLGSSILDHLRYTPPPVIPIADSSNIASGAVRLDNPAISDLPQCSCLALILSSERDSAAEDSDEDSDYVLLDEDLVSLDEDSDSESTSGAITVSDEDEWTSEGDISAQEALEIFRGTLP